MLHTPYRKLTVAFTMNFDMPLEVNDVVAYTPLNMEHTANF